MMKRYGSIMATLAVGMLAGGVFGAGCGTGGGEACLTNADCTVPGETCLASAGGGLGVSTCGCDPTAAVDSCTEADADTVCHPDRGACEQSCETDDDCTTSGEICDIATKACRAPGSLGCTTDFDCTSPDVCDKDAKTCVAPCTATSCTGTEKCNDGTKLCEPDCTLAGNECAPGSTCSAAGVCVDECGGNTCTATQVCDTSVNTCVERCTTLTGCAFGSDEVCDTGSGLCVVSCNSIDGPDCSAAGLVCNRATGLCGDSECNDSVDCDGDFCNAGVCEARLDISECTGADREYVKFETNACTPTAGNLDTCAAAEKRDSGKSEVRAGPTLFAGESVSRTASVAHCKDDKGNLFPEVQLFVDYFDAESDMATAAGASGLYGDLFQAVKTKNNDDSNTSNAIVRCGADKTDGVCEGVTNTTKQGRLLFSLCRPGDADETVAVYMSDNKGNFGNTLCIDIKPQHLNP